MPIENGDILRVLQWFRNYDGVRVRNKFYYWAVLSDAAPNDTVTAAIVEKMRLCAYALRSWPHKDCGILDTEVDHIEWDAGAWRTVAHVGIGRPAQGFNFNALPGARALTEVVTFGCGIRSMRRYYYAWPPHESVAVGNIILTLHMGRFTLFAVEALDDIALPGYGILSPVVVAAHRNAAEFLTSATFDNILDALRRRAFMTP
jgi:hypothetical protein